MAENVPNIPLILRHATFCAARKSSCGGSEKSVVTIRRRREESSEGMIRDKKIKISLIKGELSRQRVSLYSI